MLILIEGVKYYLHDFSGEEIELQRIIKEHSKDILGEESIYVEKKKITSKLSSISGIPDGFALTFWEKPKWYAIEAELSSHATYDHIVAQIQKFIDILDDEKVKNELVNYFSGEIRSQPSIEKSIRDKFGDVHEYLSNIIHNTEPTILMIIDEITKEIEKPLKRITQARTLEFRTFEREGVGMAVHAHLFEPLFQKPVAMQPEEPEERRNVSGITTQARLDGRNFLDLVIKTVSFRKFSLFSIPKRNRSFFPGYKVPFILETDIGEIKTHVTSALARTHPQVGDPEAGWYIRGELKKWYDKHPELIVGRKVRFVRLEPERYRLETID